MADARHGRDDLLPPHVQAVLRAVAELLDAEDESDRPTVRRLAAVAALREATDAMLRGEEPPHG